MAAASLPPSTSSYRMAARLRWSNARLRLRAALISRCRAAASRSIGLVTGRRACSAAQQIVPARPGPPRAVAAVVREEREPGDLEARLEVGQVGEDGVQRLGGDVLRDG